jgi:hypothetical protein
MILFHHMGENLIPALVVAAAAAGPTLLVLRTRLDRLRRRLHRQSR